MNRGIFHVVYNPMGTYKTVNEEYWYEDSTIVGSTYDCFVSANIGTSNGRPDSKGYQYVYSDQFRDLRTNAEKANIPQLLNEVESGAVNGSLGGVSDLNDTTSVTSYGTKLVVEDLEGSAQTVWNLTNKAITVHQVLKSTDSGVTWTSISFTHQAVANTITTVASDLIKVSYTSSNALANITSPLAIEQVSNYCKATNSHSIYKGNNITQVLGKVAVGNGDKGLVSKVVEDVERGADEHIVIGTNYDYTVGTVWYIDNSFTSALSGAGFYKSTTEGNYTATSSTSFSTWTYLGITYDAKIQTTPTHSTIDLDNSNSPAIKYLSTIATNDDGELAYQILATELVYNDTTSSYDGDDSEFTQLTNGTITDLNGETAKTVVSTLNLGRFK